MNYHTFAPSRVSTLLSSVKECIENPASRRPDGSYDRRFIAGFLNCSISQVNRLIRRLQEIECINSNKDEPLTKDEVVLAEKYSPHLEQFINKIMKMGMSSELESAAIDGGTTGFFIAIRKHNAKPDHDPQRLIHMMMKSTARDYMNSRRRKMLATKPGIEQATCSDNQIDEIVVRDLFEKMMEETASSRRELITKLHDNPIHYGETMSSYGKRIGVSRQLITRIINSVSLYLSIGEACDGFPTQQ